MLMHLCPDALVRPTGESFVDAVPVPVFGWQQSPLGPRAVNPYDGLDKTPAIRFPANVQAGAATQEIFHCSVDSLMFDIRPYNQMSTEPSHSRVAFLFVNKHDPYYNPPGVAIRRRPVNQESLFYLCVPLGRVLMFYFSPVLLILCSNPAFHT